MDCDIDLRDDDLPADELALTAMQCEDLSRRLANYEANPNIGASWEEVKARLQFAMAHSMKRPEMTQ